MDNQSFPQQSHQNQTKSTTVWTQPESDDQKAYYSKHAAERRVFGWISAFLQAGHGLLAFASFSAIYGWVLSTVPSALFIVPFAAAGTIMALHILFRTTWQTYWYDKLDSDPKTDSPLAVPVAILLLLLIVEVQGARMFLAGQVKPPAKESTESVDASFTALTASVDAHYNNQVKAIEQVAYEKTKAATASYNRQIKALKNRNPETDQERRAIRNQIAALEDKKDHAIQPILAAKAAELDKALQAASKSKEFEANRRQNAVAIIDNSNAGEVSRHLNELGNVDRYAWILSVCLLGIISLLLYRMVRINVKSGIIPLRNYTVLDAHGSVAERLWTAFSDAFNRQGLRFAVAIHQALSPSKPIRSFDGTVVAEPGTYNTPAGQKSQPATDEAALRSKVYQKLSEEAKNGSVHITSELLEQELEKARRMNGTYLSTPLSGKNEPSVPPAASEGNQDTQAGYDHMLRHWANRVEQLVASYDRQMQNGNDSAARETMRYINDPSGPIVKEATRLGIRFGADGSDDEVVAWKAGNDAHKVPLSLLSESALNADNHHNTNEIRFKSDLNHFQEDIKLIENGGLIGISYRREDGKWSPLGYAGVKSRLKIAQKNASEPDPSPKVLKALEKWTYAMALLDKAATHKREEVHALELI